MSDHRCPVCRKRKWYLGAIYGYACGSCRNETVVTAFEYEIPARKRTCQHCGNVGYWIISTPNGQPVCTDCLREQIAKRESDAA